MSPMQQPTDLDSIYTKFLHLSCWFNYMYACTFNLARGLIHLVMQISLPEHWHVLQLHHNTKQMDEDRKVL